MNGLTLLATGILGQWLLGFAIAELLTGRSFPDFPEGPVDAGVTFTERAGLGFVLGIGCTAGILFFWSLLGGSLGGGISLAITAVGYVAGGFALRREWLRFPVSHVQKKHSDQQPDLTQDKSWCQLCQAIIGCLFFATTAQILITPQHLWDERASFAIKGIVLAMDGSIRSRDLADPNFVQFHPRYPLLIPLAEQHIYALLGTIDDRLSKIVFPELYLGLILVMAGGLQRHLTEASAWFFALLAATMPVLVPWEYGFPCGQADASMACFHGSSALYCWDSWKRIAAEKPTNFIWSAILAGLCGALGAFTKDEGIAFLLVDAIAVVLVILLSRQLVRGLTMMTTVFGVAALLLLPWILHRQRLPLTTEANYFGRASMTTLMQKQANLEWELPHLVRRLFWEFREWGLQWWLMVVSAVLDPQKILASSQLFLLLDVVGSILSLILAGMLAATEVSEHIGGSSHRYLMQLAPVAILFAAGQLGHPRRCQLKPADTA